MQPEPVHWLVHGLWQRGKINGIAGFEKSGKSRWSNWELVGALDKDPDIRPLYLCGEETIAHVNSRIARYAEIQGVSDCQFDIDFIEAAAMRLDLRPQRLMLLDRLLNDDRNMLIIDPWRRVHGADENDSSAMAPLYNDLRKWSNQHGITVLILHHSPKLGEDTDMSRIASWFRGSTDLPAILDTAQYVNRRSRKDIQVLRQGRFPALDPLCIEDLGGSGLNQDNGFRRI